MKRRLLLTAALMVVAGAVAAVAVAATAHVSSSKVEADTTTLYWSGQGSDANFSQCDANADPGAGGFQNGATAGDYMLWIFATDGGSVSAPPTLTINGTIYDHAYKPGLNDNTFGYGTGAWQIVTPFIDPNSITPANPKNDSSTGDAYTTFQVADPGSGSWVLTISHGCAGGGRTAAENPTVTKDANGSYDNTIGWTIGKGADTDTVYSAGGGESSAVNYSVTVTHDSGTPSNVSVSGTITASNPITNGGDVTLSGVTDNILDGSDAVVASCNVDTSNGLTIAAGGTKDYPYSCALGDSLPSGDVFNYVEIAWDDQDVGTIHHLDAGSAHFETPAIEFTANPIDNCVQVTDTLDSTATTLGVACADTGDFTQDSGNNLTGFASSYDALTSTFTLTYSRTFTGDPAGTCTTHENQASVGTVPDTGGLSVALTSPTDPVDVQDCQGADLTVSKTATPAFSRDYDWSVVKSQTTSSTPINSTASNVTVGYRVRATWSGPTDSGWQVSGTITVSNPNDWEPVTLTGVSDSIDHSGNCSINAADAAKETATLAPKGQTGDSVTLGYTCTFTSNPGSGTNTGTATWSASAAHTPDGSNSGTHTYDFSTVTPTVTHDTTTVTDAFNNGSPLTLGVANVNGTFTKALGNTLANWTQSYTSATKTFTFTYTRSVAVVPNSCTEYDNTATVSADATSGDNSSSASVVVCGRVTGGLTIGFWSNNNGKAVLCATANYPKWVQLLNGNWTTAPYNGGSYLRNANGTYFTVTGNSCSTADTNFANWLLAANSTNASYMLSAQLAGTILNVNFNNMNGNLCVAGNGGTPISINNLISAVITFLKANGNTTQAGAARTLAVNYQTILNNLNNGQGFVVPGSC